MSKQDVVHGQQADHAEQQRYVVSLRGLRRVEGAVVIVARSPEEARALAEQRVDHVVVEHLGWEVDYESPVTAVEAVSAEREDV